LQHLHPLRPKTAKIESRQQARHWRSHKTVAEGDRPSAIQATGMTAVPLQLF
jgi:hypothetical protein